MSTETLERSGTAGAASGRAARKVSFRMMTTMDDLPAITALARAFDENKDGVLDSRDQGIWGQLKI